MKQNILLMSILLFCSLSAYGQNTHQIILKLKKDVEVTGSSFGPKNSVGNKKVDAVSKKFFAEKITQQSAGKKLRQYFYVIKFPTGTDILQVIKAYEQTGEVEYAEPDYPGAGTGIKETIPNDPYYARQWALKNDGLFSLYPAIVGADIEMENAWSIEQGDSNIVVAVIDSGVKLNHPEFAGRIWINYNETPGNGIDDDQNGLIDDVKGWDFAYDDNNPADDYGHGTNVTGIIGANANNTKGYAGIDWNCKLMILKGVDVTNFGYYSWWAAAIYYAVDNGAKVINMSLGGTSSSTTLHNAVIYALSNKVTVVASMGNLNSNTAHYPASIPGIIAVGATNSDDTRAAPFFWDQASGSCYGNYISVVAPGNYIYGLNYESNTNYGTYWGGTSQAAPMVSGLAALLLAQDPTRSPAQIKQLIETTAEDQVGAPGEDAPGWDQYYGYGRINAFHALSIATGTSTANLTNQNFLLFPNPTTRIFTAMVPAGTTEIQIFNAFGKSIATKQIDGQSTCEFQLLEPGAYYLKITVDKQIVSRKIIVSQL